MIIGIDNSPLVSTHKLAHKIRGTGFYTKHLIEALEKYHPENKYVFFQQGTRLQQNIDLFHFPYFDPFFLTLPFRKLGKTIITIHDLTPIIFPELFPIGIKGRVKYSIQKQVSKKANAIITDSDSSKKDITKLLGIKGNKVFSIPLAAGEHFKKLALSSTQKENFLKKYNLPEKFVLYVGDATPNKNLPALVDAVRIADAPLVIVGGAIAKEDIDRKHPWNKDIVYVQQAAFKNKKIKILGFISDEDLVFLYNVATVFVFPSLYEGFGLPVLEAAACGCPVITAKSGSIPEVIGDAGIYINPQNPYEIAKAISLVFVDEKRRSELAKKGIVQAEKFSWKHTADNTIKIYEKIYTEA